jgi:1,4-dihydroxy-2-naphthoyl-CoA hydrolase
VPGVSDELSKVVSEAMPLAVLLGIQVKEVTAEQTVLRLDWRAELCTAGGILHGGALMTLADCAGAACAFARLTEIAPGSRTSTIESSTHFFAAVRAGTVTATARPLHSGRSTIVVQTERRDDSGKLVGLTTQTQAVLRA